MEASTTHDKVRELRAIKVDDNLELDLKKVMFGGYDCKEVREYISILKSDMQLSENVFNEKLEECSAASEMYLRERDKFLQIISDTEKKANQYKTEAYESAELNKRHIVQVEKENEELKELINSLQQQIENDEQTRKLKEEIKQLNKDNQELKNVAQILQDQIDDNKQNQKIIVESEEIKEENKKLNDNIFQLNKSNIQLLAEIEIVNTALQKALNIMQTLKDENKELKKTINSLRTLNRNNILDTSMNIFKYRESQNLSIDNISNNINEVLNVINTMKADLFELFDKTKIESEE